MSQANTSNELTIGGADATGADGGGADGGGADGSGADATGADSSGAGLDGGLDTLALEALEGKVIDVLKTVYDPEIPVDIYELGLIYKIDIQPDLSIDIDMTLTSPACPAAGSLPPEVEFKVASIPEVSDVRVNIVWEPTWTPEFMSEAAKLELNMW